MTAIGCPLDIAKDCVVARRSVRCRSGLGGLCCLLVGAFIALLQAPHAEASGPVPAKAGSAWRLTIDGAIGPATADYVTGALTSASANDVPIVVLQMDTPGGLDHAMRDMVRAILDSPVPVACLVAPRGARAASAGTFLLYACHVAAMAPATNLGAASPVAIGGGSQPQGETEEGDQRGASTGERKAMNDAAAYLRALAELRGRNADWAEAAVREAATLTATGALEQGVIDLIAEDAAALLVAIDGRMVQLGSQTDAQAGTQRLDTADLTLIDIEPDWRQRLLAVLTDPNVAYILMMVGIYGLLLEFYSPGALIPGIAGGICLLLALYAFQVLPISYSGLALLLLGVALMVAEAAAPSFGVLGLGGVVAFVAGSVLLFDDKVPGLRLALPLVMAVAAVSLAAVLLIVGAALRMRRAGVAGTIADWVGQEAEAAESFAGEGLVRIHGELWRARCDIAVERGARLRVLAVDDMVFTVAPVSAASL